MRTIYLVNRFNFKDEKKKRNVDGELISGDKFEIKLMPNALKLDINPYFWNMKF